MWPWTHRSPIPWVIAMVLLVLVAGHITGKYFAVLCNNVIWNTCVMPTNWFTLAHDRIHLSAQHWWIKSFKLGGNVYNTHFILISIAVGAFIMFIYALRYYSLLSMVYIMLQNDSFVCKAIADQCHMLFGKPTNIIQHYLVVQHKPTHNCMEWFFLNLIQGESVICGLLYA